MRVLPVVVTRPRRVADDHSDVQPLLTLHALVVAGEELVVHRVAGFVRLERVGQDDVGERLVTLRSRRVVIRRLDVDGGDVVRQQNHLVGVNLFRVFAPQVVRLHQAALNQSRYERPRPRELVYDVDALIPDGDAELHLQRVFHAADDIVHDFRRGIDDAQTVDGRPKSRLEEPAVKVLDDPLPARGGGHAMSAKANVSVEVFQSGGLFLQSPPFEAVHHPLHRARHGVAVDEVVILEQRVEHRLGHQMLREHRDGVVFAHTVVQITPQSG